MDISPYPDPAPAGGALQEDVLRARVTQTALDFIGSNLDSLLAQFLAVEGDEAVFYVDDTVLPPDSPILMRSGSKLSLDLETLQNALKIQWLPVDGSSGEAAGIRLSLTELELFADMLLLTNLDTNLIPAAACHIQSRAGIPAIRIEEISFDMLLGINASGATSVLSVTPSNIVIDFDTDSQQPVLALDITPCDGSDPLDPTCVDPACSAEDANCPDLCEVLSLASELGDFLFATLDPVMDEIGAALEASIGQTLADSLAGLPLGIETQVDVGGMVGTMFRDVGPLSIKVGASEALGVAGEGPGRGLDLGLLGGMTTTVPAKCTTGVEPPDLSSMLGAPPEFTGFVELTDEDGNSHFERYHLALSVSQAIISQGAWGLFQSGLLCLGLDAYDIEAMTDGSFGFTSGLLISFEPRLVGIAEMDAPMQLTITASGPPRIRLGAGFDIAEGVPDPLIQADIDDLRFDISMFIDDSYLRVVGLSADVSVDLDIERTEDAGIKLVIRDIAIANSTQLYNELAPEADISGLFSTIIDLAIDTLLGDNLEFAFDVADTLSDSLGVPVELRLNTIRRDLGTTGVPYISMYATLCSPDQAQNPEDITCYLPAVAAAPQEGDVNVEVDGASMFEQPAHYALPSRFIGVPSGHVDLHIATNQALEYQYRVDGGMWRSWREATDGVLRVTNGRLKVAGDHEIELRYREPNGTSNYATQFISVLVDPERPQLSHDPDAGPAAVKVSEFTTPEDVELLQRPLNEGSTWSHATIDALPAACERYGQLEVKAKDRAGLESNILVLACSEGVPPGSLASLTNAESSDEANSPCCTGAPGQPLLWLLLVGMWMRRRRAA